MKLEPKRTALSTLRRDTNAKYIGLARMVSESFLQDRQAIGLLISEVQRMRAREWIWAVGLGVLAVCVVLLAAANIA
jgi:hypothetical protein